MVEISMDHINYLSGKSKRGHYFILCYLCPIINIQCVGQKSSWTLRGRPRVLEPCCPPWLEISVAPTNFPPTLTRLFTVASKEGMAIGLDTWERQPWLGTHLFKLGSYHYSSRWNAWYFITIYIFLLFEKIKPQN